jgi:hypothetical protein
MNGDFETGSTGATPTNWVQRINAGLAGSTQRTADAIDAVNGGNVVRLQTTAINSGLSLVQPDWVNPALNGTGLMSANLNDTYILRANVRTSGTVASKVRARIQLFNTAGYVTTSPMSAAAPADTAGRWVPIEVEFVPATILAGSTFSRAEIMLSNDSSTGYAEFDGVTLMQRKNTATNPGLLDTTPANGIEDSWGRRLSGTGAITYNGTGTPKYVRMSKTVATDGNQFYQTHTATSTLAGRLNEKWRLRARVRHNGLNAAGAQLKVQLFDGAGAYLSSSPLGPVLSGTSPTTGSGWVETVLEFNPRELVGSATFGKAEIMMQNNSATGYVDVSFISLEAVD